MLLAGDAAHIHSTLGGQGLNLGLGDAMNFGWKLAATIRGGAPEGLLNSYAQERHPARRADTRLVTSRSRSHAAERQLPRDEAIIRDLMDTRDGTTYFAGRVWGVGIRYDLGGHHSPAGRSVPDFQLGNGDRVKRPLRTDVAFCLIARPTYR